MAVPRTTGRVNGVCWHGGGTCSGHAQPLWHRVSLLTGRPKRARHFRIAFINHRRIHSLPVNIRPAVSGRKYQRLDAPRLVRSGFNHRLSRRWLSAQQLAGRAADIAPRAQRAHGALQEQRQLSVLVLCTVGTVRGHRQNTSITMCMCFQHRHRLSLQSPEDRVLLSQSEHRERSISCLRWCCTV